MGMGRVPNIVLPRGVVREKFKIEPETSMDMEQCINLWNAMYTNQPPWQTDRVYSTGIPAAICREMARPALVEFSADITGGQRADYLAEQFDAAQEHFLRDLETGLALGGIAFKPYVYGGRILVDATGAAGFQPTKFDAADVCVGGVFKSRPVRDENGEYYIRMERHELNGTTYTIENKAFKSDESGTVGDEVALDVLPEWAEIQPLVSLDNITGPLFAYFRTPLQNNIDPQSHTGVSIYSGAAVNLIRQADEQWADILWEYRSGKRKIYTEGTGGLVENFDKELFETAPLSGDGSLFHEFTPEFRDDALYRGFQNTLKLIEYNVGLAYGDISDPQAVERTATEIRSAKQRKYVTVESIKTALEAVFRALLYGMDVYATLYKLAPAGDYDAAFAWGDSVLDDEETKQARYADMRLDATGGFISRLYYVTKKYGLTEKEALKIMPDMEDMVDEEQNEVE